MFIIGLWNHSGSYNTVYGHSTSQLVGVQPVAKANVSRGWQDAQSCPPGVRLGTGRHVLQLQLEVEQYQTHKLLDLIDSKEPTRTFGGAWSKGHEEVLEPLSFFVKICLLVAILKVAVKVESLPRNEISIETELLFKLSLSKLQVAFGLLVILKTAHLRHLHSITKYFTKASHSVIHTLLSCRKLGAT